MTIIDFPHEMSADAELRTTTAHAALDEQSAAHRFALPRRFDVHQIDVVIDEVLRLGAEQRAVEVDGSFVEMIDLVALETLSQLVDDVSVRVASPSVALRVTAEYTGHDVVTACFVDDELELAEVA